jgi:hypothetical protein
MTKQHHSSFTRAILNSTQRLFAPRNADNLLATRMINAHTLKDIGVNPAGIM